MRLATRIGMIADSFLFGLEMFEIGMIKFARSVVEVISSDHGFGSCSRLGGSRTDSMAQPRNTFSSHADFFTHEVHLHITFVCICKGNESTTCWLFVIILLAGRFWLFSNRLSSCFCSVKLIVPLFRVNNLSTVLVWLFNCQLSIAELNRVAELLTVFCLSK